MLMHSEPYSLEVPPNYTRRQVTQYSHTHSEVRGKAVRAVPDSPVRQRLYLMYMKIGATSELPTDPADRVSFLNDLWCTMYLNNHLCPDDIPFSLIINKFTVAMVQGRAERKGNNQAAIVQAFNNWITQMDVRNQLYQERDQFYPSQKPEQLPEQATQPTLADYSVEQLKKKLASIAPLAGIRMVNQMIEELEEEISLRGVDNA